MLCETPEALQQATWAWKQIKYLGRQRIKDQAGLDCPGLYAFTRRSDTPSYNDIIYVGIARGKKPRGQYLQKRLSDYLAKEITVLDCWLRDQDAQSAKSTLRMQIECVMRKSAPEAIEKYVSNHLKSWALSKSDELLTFPVDLEVSADLIEAAESALIHTAQPNVNRAKKKMGRPRSAWIGVDLAQQAVAGWVKQGLGQGLAHRWIHDLDLLRP